MRTGEGTGVVFVCGNANQSDGREYLVRVGLEAGSAAEWIGRHLIDDGFQIVCMESGHVKAALSGRYSRERTSTTAFT